MKKRASRRVAIVEIFPAGDRWFVMAQVKFFSSQRQAIAMARPLAKQLEAELVIRDIHGRIRAKDSHGHDPREIKG